MTDDPIRELIGGFGVQGSQVPDRFRGIMTRQTRYRIIASCLLVALMLPVSGCSVYFNTFFNARKAFGAAEKARKESKRSTAGQRDYQTAIEKALKVVERHPNSKYYDDAVYMLGVSYFHTRQYAKAERRFRELLANYEESRFAKESRLYLAKAKLELGDIDDAMIIFEEIFKADYEKSFKAEAAVGLGTYHQEEKEYEQARRYFMAVRDSLGDKISSLEAQVYIADGYYELFQFRDALGAYLQVLGMEPDRNLKYHAQYRAALCSFRLQKINDGLDYLEELVRDELYYDSIGVLKLTMAEGYEYDDDLEQAEATYEDVAATSERPLWQSLAYYRLGLIYQIDYDRLDRAKEYYDMAAEADRSSPIRLDAITRSSDIGKLETFARNPLDSTASPAAIDEAAYTQYLLAELYWFKLNKPDSALIEIQYLVDSFSTSYYAPKGMVALAQMTRDHLEDGRAADSILKAMLKAYPHSDFVPEALEALSLLGTAADTGYAALYIGRAEDFLIEDDNSDSARVYYQYVIDNFPDSKFFVPAKFALLWLDETYDSPGDSSVVFAYQEFADSFPGNEYAALALQRIGGQPLVLAEVSDERKDSSISGETGPGVQPDADLATDWEDTTGYIDPMIALYRGPEGDTLVDLRLEPIETLVEFEFPAEAPMGQQYDWRLYFQILIDFSGRVVDYSLKIPSGIEEIDERAQETVGSMTFDAMSVSNRVVDAGLTDKRDGEGYWFVYQYTVIKPEYLR